MTVFAHSLPGQSSDQWEELSHHLKAVAERAGRFAGAFGHLGTGRVLGLLHDIGKVSWSYQAYIAASRPDGGGAKGPDHSSAGAREAMQLYPPALGRMLAYAVAGHHAGLADGEELERRLSNTYQIEPYDGWQAHAGSLPTAAQLRPARMPQHGPHAGFGQAFLIRMLFSCLVDADFLATESFYQAASGPGEPSVGAPQEHASMGVLRDRLRGYMAGLRSASDETVASVRAEVLAHAVAKATMPPGVFTLTVPTGGGKTLTSLSFALEHAVHHAMRRIVYVIPFTSIIEQTADVFRRALNIRDDVLEHHASFEPSAADSAGEGPAGLEKLRRAAETWDVPIVVTTAVQFFESLFANRPSRCRKLHNLAGSVIVLDEAQTLPLPVLRPCVAALDELARNYGASVVLCTATQPALRSQDAFEGGFDIGNDRELAPDPKRLYTVLKRVQVTVRPGTTDDATIAERFARQDRMLCVVNSRAHAKAIYEAIRHLPGACHLSTLMVPRHRRAVLADLRQRLADGQPVRVVSTSLIEAGVDIDFPEVWRAAAGLDSIAQAAGRCNRNGLLPELGRCVVFLPPKDVPHAQLPREIAGFWQATRPVLRQHGDDLLGLDAVLAYFRELYWQKEGNRSGLRSPLDAIEVVEGRFGVLPVLADRARDLGFPFRSLAATFRLIEETMEPVIVPYDQDAVRLLAAIAGSERPATRHLRGLQQYVVTIPRPAHAEWQRLGALRPVHPALPSGLLKFEDTAHYREATGLDLTALGLRDAASNVL